MDQVTETVTETVTKITELLKTSIKNFVDEKEGFGNLFSGIQLNDTCIVITLIFIVIFMYKEELMKTKVIKDLVK